MRNCKIQCIKYKSGHLDIHGHVNSLDGRPDQITGEFDCSNNDLTDLVGGPTNISGSYNCSENRLVTLLGSPEYTSADFDCAKNNLSSLVGIHKIIKSCRVIMCSEAKITEGGIGLLLIANMEHITSKHEPFKIINSYLGKGTKGMMECSKELISRGFPEYAKL